jgi:holo-[acyl-carrier protein] synthase
MEFIGLGHDIIEVSRIEKSLASHGERFYLKLFTPEEIAYCLSKADPAIHFAGRFAAKEAIAKGLGTGFGEHVKWLEISIINDFSGKPKVKLTGKTALNHQDFHIAVSISHIKELASAVAFIYQF